MTLLVGAIIVAAAIWAVARRADVRLVLTLAGIALAALAGDPRSAVRVFLATFSNEQFVIPICTAMGFAYVLRYTECDQHLVRLLSAPVRRVRPLLIPGTVVIGFLVNIPLVSQTSTAVTVGAVLLPLLRAAGVAPVTAGAALLLGTSLGGELLNPSTPEFQTVSVQLKIPAGVCVSNVIAPLFVHLAVATSVFWLLNWPRGGIDPEAVDPKAPEGNAIGQPPACEERVNYFMALVPLVPVILLFLTGSPHPLIPVNWSWLLSPEEEAAGMKSDTRRIGVAMLVGVVLAALASGRKAKGVTSTFFEGSGYAFMTIIPLIVAASCFGEGIKALGLADHLKGAVEGSRWLVVLSAVVLPLGFACLSGSGYAATQSLFGHFVDPARQAGLDPIGIGGVVSMSAAAGRTMSPVAAVTLMSASLTGTEPLALVRRVALPLAAGLAASLATRALLGW